MNQKILFLYTELAGYTLACIKSLEKHPTDIHVVRWPINQEAPFEFNFSENTRTYDRNDFDDRQLMELALLVDPDVIYCSGWMDKGYLNVSKYFKKKGKPVIVGFDNQWTGSVKQYVAALLSPFYIKNHFSFAWIPGEPQYKFAKHLGFKDDHILRGVYSADTDHFNSYYQQSAGKKSQFPHRFLYVGRYVDWKGINELWDAFRSLGDERRNWELWCLGAGELYDTRPDIPGIRHVGFVQPQELGDYINQTSVFVLPSRFEPWGVVLHEYATAGFPILTTPQVGAASQFVRNGINGWFFESNNSDSLKEKMLMVINTSDEKLIEMGEKSRELAEGLSPEVWAKTLLSVL